MKEPKCTWCDGEGGFEKTVGEWEICEYCEGTGISHQDEDSHPRRGDR